MFTIYWIRAVYNNINQVQVNKLNRKIVDIFSGNSVCVTADLMAIVNLRVEMEWLIPDEQQWFGWNDLNAFIWLMTQSRSLGEEKYRSVHIFFYPSLVYHFLVCSRRPFYLFIFRYFWERDYSKYIVGYCHRSRKLDITRFIQKYIKNSTNNFCLPCRKSVKIHILTIK